ncbi:MAG: hypothetical protein HRU06_06690 [Oceanospirillaceae bacterium]|nr:hypothetical protein [Oceanospirillaceae bacterium]
MLIKLTQHQINYFSEVEAMKDCREFYVELQRQHPDKLIDIDEETALKNIKYWFDRAISKQITSKLDIYKILIGVCFLGLAQEAKYDLYEEYLDAEIANGDNLIMMDKVAGFYAKAKLKSTETEFEEFFKYDK